MNEIKLNPIGIAFIVIGVMLPIAIKVISLIIPMSIIEFLTNLIATILLTVGFLITLTPVVERQKNIALAMTIIGGVLYLVVPLTIYSLAHIEYNGITSVAIHSLQSIGYALAITGLYNLVKSISR